MKTDDGTTERKIPETLQWINSLEPFIVIRGEKQVIVKFSDGRETLALNYEKIQAFGNNARDEAFSWI